MIDSLQLFLFLDDFLTFIIFSDYSEGDVVYGEMQWATVADLKPMQKVSFNY